MIELTKQECRKDLTDRECVEIMRGPVEVCIVVYGVDTVSTILEFILESDALSLFHGQSAENIPEKAALNAFVKHRGTVILDGQMEMCEQYLGSAIGGLTSLANIEVVFRATRWTIGNLENVQVAVDNMIDVYADLLQSANDCSN